MDLATYIDISSRWLLDTTNVFDLAESLSKAMGHSYEIPKDENWENGPFISSWKGREVIQAALPLLLKTSIESAKAAELAMGSDHEPDALGKTKVPFVNNKSPRVGAILARAGIISQFELWKSFATSLGYPVNRKQATKFQFKSADEMDGLHEIVDLRNALTHEIEIHNDPTMRQLVEYTYLCHYLARQAEHD